MPYRRVIPAANRTCSRDRLPAHGWDRAPTPSVWIFPSVCATANARSHPARDQSQLCMGNHPLNGCATVDYGAFGITHDNRLTVAGDGAPVELHLHKDRSVQPRAEPLPPDE